ncbi:MAG TPA: hypothetical protein VHZ55_31790 [Bryobacteraceae bacterium]|jgi:hypothetical protein|nr:hypothetical protein [Bryobacteraceae bacterium]
MKKEIPSWGAPRIYGEVLLLGFDISEPSVSRYLQQLKRMPDENKASHNLTFLNNHREAIAAGAFCISTLRCIQQAIGSCNNYAKHSRCRALIDTSCSTMPRSSE